MRQKMKNAFRFVIMLEALFMLTVAWQIPPKESLTQLEGFIAGSLALISVLLLTIAYLVNEKE